MEKNKYTSLKNVRIICENQIDFTPKVSVIIPVYNVELYLRQCLDSVVNQTLKEIEIICVDDGSTDNSLEILKEYANKDKRITLISVEHIGTGTCRNLAIEKAKGGYIGFVNPDDWVELAYFKKLYKETENEKNDIVFQSVRIEINTDTGQQIKMKTPNSLNDIEFRYNIIDVQAHLWSKIFKKDFIEQYNIRNYTSKRSQDLLFTIPAILLAKNIKCIENAEYYYRKGHHSACQIKWELIDAIESLNLYDKIREKLTEFNFDNLSLVNIKENKLCKKIQTELNKEDLIEFNKIINNLHFIDSRTNANNKGSIIINNPAPDNIKKIWWGDYWLGLDLAQGLKKQNLATSTNYADNMNIQEEGKISITLRGFVKFDNINKRNLNILYIISHPELITKEEIEQYDLVYCCSKKWTKQIKKFKKRTYYLPQFTNTERFYPEKNNKYKNKVLYVGNAHKGMREAVKYALNENIEVSVYGNFWENYIEKKYIKGLYIDNNELNKYYSNAEIVLNDTISEMKENGFISNRIFDVAACKGFLISDYMPEIEKIFGDAIPMYKNQKELKNLIEYYLNHPEKRREKAEKAYNIVAQKYNNLNVANKIKKHILKYPNLKYDKKNGNYYKLTKDEINTPLQTFFSVKNKGCHKVLTIFGIKMKFKNQKLALRNEINFLGQRTYDLEIQAHNLNLKNIELNNEIKKLTEKNNNSERQIVELKKNIKQLCANFQDYYKNTTDAFPIELTKDEKITLVKYLNESKNYLEFGSGGSTFLALSTMKTKIYSIESDINWIEHLKTFSTISNSIENGKLNLYHINIGKTKEWGYSINDDLKENYPNYSSEIFEKIKKDEIDLVLIDGRFRVACGLQTIINCSKNAKIIIHDYTKREEYHILEEFLDIIETIDTLAVFKIKDEIDTEKAKNLYEEYKFKTL